MSKIELFDKPPAKSGPAAKYAEFFETLTANPYKWAKFEGNPGSARSSARCAATRNHKAGIGGVFIQKTVDKEHWFSWRAE